ncbi:hypothetical protein DCCM_0363 [Desulfocucumis palustris]|uniref:Cyclic lactone autoinducer peptide n=1 Tax=Desulfocucumis palustris TaxID=1898651 RepID=A0A2L2X848_9FIRM|nr:cyclic lactone autoinducer peptide [Desulfocucumis palustris]GBF32172.1 hypothetical protein DCCM_0363 [Desulfocucumis palustris]
MRNIMSKVFLFTVTVLLFLASITAASACAFTHYQPELPESLRK